MKYTAISIDKIPKDDRIEIAKVLNALDTALYKKAKELKGVDYWSLVNAGKPFINKFGAKEFATSELIKKSVNKLVKVGLLEVR